MRAELRGILEELKGTPQPEGLDGSTPPPRRPSLADRSRLWDLAVKLGRELGAEVDVPAPVSPEERPRRARRVDFG